MNSNCADRPSHSPVQNKVQGGWGDDTPGRLLNSLFETPKDVRRLHTFAVFYAAMSAMWLLAVVAQLLWGDWYEAAVSAGLGAPCLMTSGLSYLLYHALMRRDAVAVDKACSSAASKHVADRSMDDTQPSR